MRPDSIAPASPGNISPHVEIAYILFMDIVAFSRLSIETQVAQISELQDLVRTASEVHRADAEGELIRRPTGDGMALVFFRDALWPVRAAVEISRELKRRPHLHLRMGIHSGPVYRIRDINNNFDVQGEGIVTAQRVMDFGDASHILLSKHVADMLKPLDPWNRYIDALGEWKTKNGIPVDLYNFSTKEIGNQKFPQKLNAAKAQEMDAARRRALHFEAPTLPPGLRNALTLLLWFAAVVSLAVGAAWIVSPNAFRPIMRETYRLLFPPPDAGAEKFVAGAGPKPRGAKPAPKSGGVKSGSAQQAGPKPRGAKPAPKSGGVKSGSAQQAGPETEGGRQEIKKPPPAPRYITYRGEIRIAKSRLDNREVTIAYEIDNLLYPIEKQEWREDADAVRYVVEFRYRRGEVPILKVHAGDELLHEGDPSGQAVISIGGEAGSPANDGESPEPAPEESGSAEARGE